MFLKGFLVIFGCLFIGQVIIALTDLPLPPSVIGLVVLFAALQSGLVKLATVEKLAKVLMDYLVLLVSLGLLFLQLSILLCVRVLKKVR